MKEILPLTSLRFFAAFYLFLFHLHIRWPITSNKYISKILYSGATGMTIFFMLSGYILAYRYHLESKLDLKKYYKSRFARIYPIYFIAALITIPWIGVDIKDFDIYQIAKLLILIFSNILLVQAWLPQTFHFWNCGGSWSVSAEAFFYLSFPFFKKLIKNMSRRNLIFIIVSAYFAAVVPGISYVAFENKFGEFYSIPAYRLPEFVIGICCFEISRTLPKRNYDFYLISVLILLLVYLAKFNSYIYITHNWIIIPILGCVIILLEKSNGFVYHLLSSKLFVWLGKISYCFYSFQALIILSLIQYKSSKGQVSIAFIEIAVLIIILIIMSVLGYHFIEEPSRHKINQFSIK